MQVHQCDIQWQVNRTSTHCALQQQAFILFYELCSDSEAKGFTAMKTNEYKDVGHNNDEIRLVWLVHVLLSTEQDKAFNT